MSKSQEYTAYGKHYNSFSELCKGYPQLSPMTIWRRIHELGMSPEEAVEKEIKGYRDIDVSTRTDHLGNVFETKKKMLEHYHIAYNTFDARIAKGYTLEEALTGNFFEYHDLNGKGFHTKREMMEANGISKDRYLRLQQQGFTIEEILKGIDPRRHTLKSRTDHLGNVYDSVDDMCKAYGVNKGTFQDRKKHGWPLKDCLLGRGHVKPSVAVEDMTDPFGVVYSSVSKMCEYYNVTVARYYIRIKKYRYTKLEALGISPRLSVDTHGVLVCNKLKVEDFVGMNSSGQECFACSYPDGVEEVLSKSEILGYALKHYRKEKAVC